VHQHQPPHRAGHAQPAEHLTHGQQHHLHGHENAKQHEGKQGLAAPKLPLGEHITVERTDQGREQHRWHHHHHRVPEVGLETFALHPGAGAAPGFEPSIQRRCSGQAQQVASAQLLSVFKRGGQHHIQRHQKPRCKEQQHGPQDEAMKIQAVHRLLRNSE
jgi:hypothetical protein